MSVGRGVPVVKSWGYTYKEAIKFSYTWSIINFSLFHEENGKVLVSPKFSSDTNDKIKWRLKLYVNGENEKSKDYVSLFLYLVSPEETKVEVKGQLSILNAKGVRSNKIDFQYVYEDAGGRGYRKFIERNTLLDKSQGYLSDDKLTIVCQGDVIKNSVTVAGQSNPRKIKVPNCDLSENLGEVFENQKFSDVVLSVKGTEFKVHKNILSARSPVFAAMFEHDLAENRNGKVDITDFDGDVIEEMLTFMYTGKTSKLDEMAEGLLGAADKYDLDRLKAMCEKQLYANLSIENASRVLILADLHNANQLKDQTIDFLNKNATVIKKTSGYKKMFKSHPYLIAEAFDALAIK